MNRWALSGLILRQNCPCLEAKLVWSSTSNNIFGWHADFFSASIAMHHHNSVSRGGLCLSQFKAQAEVGCKQITVSAQISGTPIRSSWDLQREEPFLPLQTYRPHLRRCDVSTGDMGDSLQKATCSIHSKSKIKTHRRGRKDEQYEEERAGCLHS